MLAGDVAAAATTAPDGRPMSINVEVIGGSMIVQHYVEETGEPHHLQLVSRSDLFTPAGRSRIDVVWDLRVRRIDDATCAADEHRAQLRTAGAAGVPGPARTRVRRVRGWAPAQLGGA